MRTALHTSPLSRQLAADVGALSRPPFPSHARPRERSEATRCYALPFPSCSNEAASDQSSYMAASAPPMIQDELNFEYTAYAIRSKERKVRPGRMDMSKLSRSKRVGGVLSMPDKGFHAFEQWTGSSAILRDTELEPAFNAAAAAPSASLDPLAPPSSTNGSAAPRRQDRRMKEVRSSTAGPEWMSTESDRWRTVKMQSGCQQAPANRHVATMADLQSVSSSDRPATLPGSQPSGQTAPHKDQRPLRPAAQSTSSDEYDKEVPSTDLGSRGPCTGGSKQWRLVGGCRALGITPGHATSVLPLLLALVATEPRDVRRCVRALRRCLGGIPFKRAAAIVCKEPRLIGMSEQDMAMQVRGVSRRKSVSR